MGERESGSGLRWNCRPRSGDDPVVHAFLVLACSGPGAAAAIFQAELTALGGLVLALALWSAGGLRRRRAGRAWGAVARGVLPVALHPMIWLSARSGDCGRTLTAASVAMAVISLTWAAWPMKSPAPRVG